MGQSTRCVITAAAAAAHAPVPQAIVSPTPRSHARTERVFWPSVRANSILARAYHLVGETVNEDHAVRIAHRYSCDVHLFIGNVDAGVKHRISGEIHRDFGGRCYGQSHVYGYALNKTVKSLVQLQRLYAAECLYCDMIGLCYLIVRYKLCYTSDAVAAHLSFRSVGIEYTHTAVGFVAWQYDNYAVGVEAGVTVAHFDSE